MKGLCGGVNLSDTVYSILIHTGKGRVGIVKPERRVVGIVHRARIPSPLPLRVAKTGRNHLNEEFTPFLPTGIGERF